MLSEYLPLRVVTDDFDIDKGAYVKLLRSEHRHIVGGCLNLEPGPFS